MYALRLWSTRNARLLERVYEAFETTLVAAHPVLKAIGYRRLEKPVALVEKVVKGALFDCQMCGACALSRTGMTCPMNCPKQLRNGPCGGVRDGGYCEVKPDMRCVWAEAYLGSLSMANGAAIREPREPVDRRLQGTSAWLSVARSKGEAAGEGPHPR